MQITVNIPDDLAAQAQARGLALDRYLTALLAADLAEVSGFSPGEEARRVTAKLAELEQLFEEMTRYSDQIPALPEGTFTRESIYQDHD